MKLGICDDEAVVHHQVKEYINDIDFGIPLEVTDFYNGEAIDRECKSDRYSSS